ncbi:MAG: hypothetical protein EA375_05335 [Acholeplasmataceae bacterium]|nr:MAG: hypothetical protein EA375_05335 [Acholeplasmataceae bacterium]
MSSMNNAVNLDWQDPSKATLYGCSSCQSSGRLDRLPADLLTSIGQSNPALPGLGRMTAGMMLAFTTDSQILDLEASLFEPPLLNHMAATGQSGFDLYRFSEGLWRFIDVSRPSLTSADHGYRFNLPFSADRMGRYLLYFPLYNAVKGLRLKVESGAVCHAWQPYQDPPVLIYGTSLTQGACASRPGLAYPAMLGRKWGVAITNFGFSGNALLEPVMAQAITRQVVSAIIIDCEANAGAADVLESRLPAFIETIRTVHRQTPLILVSRMPWLGEWHDQAFHERRRRYHRFQQAMAETRQDIEPLLYLSGEALLSEDASACTVDGIHLNDHGFAMLADQFDRLAGPWLVRQGILKQKGVTSCEN